MCYLQVHVYSSAEAKAASNEKCCGAERISAGLSCCNSVGFNPVLQACADTSIMNSGTDKRKKQTKSRFDVF